MNLQDTLQPKWEGFSYGVDPKRLSAALRELADDISAGRAQVSAVKLIQTSKIEDFYQQSLIVRFIQKADRPSPPVING